MRFRITYLVALIALAAVSGAQSFDKFIADVRAADYHGDRAALEKLFTASESLVGSKEPQDWVHYWRGFALWRKAINGFNDGIGIDEQTNDLTRACNEFEKPSSLTDSKIAEAACLMSLTFMHQSEADKVKLWLPKFMGLLNDAEKEAQGNPRFYWVKGPELWYMPKSRGGGEDLAFAAYQKGLEACKKQPKSPFYVATWGEPELLMNLAWSELHRKEPDLKAARNYAKKALKIVPDWHYVRDILLPQIEAAMKSK